MLSLTVAGGAAVAMIFSGVVGFILQKTLPETHTTSLSRDIIGGVVGMLVLLLALVLGLLIWTAYGVTNTQKTELQLLSARALEFDLEMKQYGPEAEQGRELLRTEIVWAHEQFWGDENAKSEAYQASYKNMGTMSTFLNSLAPANNAQKQLLGAACAALRGDRGDAAVDVAAIDRSGVVAIDLHGHRMVLPAVLRIWRVVAAERNDLCRAGAGLRSGRERALPHP